MVRDTYISLNSMIKVTNFSVLQSLKTEFICQWNTLYQQPFSCVSNIHLKSSKATKEMQIKTTLRFHLTFVRIAIIRNSSNNRCWQACGEMEPLYTACLNAN
jgi:hypothetical protein